jgi:Gas vesicle synthesis protein GvpL/GvpF
MARSGAKPARYVYGVIRGSARAKPKVKGIHDKPLRTVRSGALGALVSDVPEAELEAGREELLTHSRVLEEALALGPVLPMRFGVVMPDESAVRAELLDAHGDALEAQLEELGDKVELNVKGLYDEGSVLRELIAEDPAVAELRAVVQDRPEEAAYFERIRLGELVAEGLTAKREADEREILGRLAPHAVEVEQGKLVHEHMVVNSSFLVERTGLTRFDEALEKLAAEQHPRIGFKLTGPLPPHSFVELSLEA